MGVGFLWSNYLWLSSLSYQCKAGAQELIYYSKCVPNAADICTLDVQQVYYKVLRVFVKNNYISRTGYVATIPAGELLNYWKYHCYRIVNVAYDALSEWILVQ